MTINQPTLGRKQSTLETSYAYSKKICIWTITFPCFYYAYSLWTVPWTSSLSHVILDYFLSLLSLLWKKVMWNTVLESCARIIVKLMLMLKICNTACPYRLNFVIVQKIFTFPQIPGCETFFQALLYFSLGLELISLSHVLVHNHYCVLQNGTLMYQWIR